MSEVKKILKDRLVLLLSLLMTVQASVNIIGALGPETSFDALWYHLTLPKIYLSNGAISFIPGNLFYYSAMPQLTEMLYSVVLSFGSEITAKLLHFSFGIFCLIAIFRLSRSLFPVALSLVAVFIFYSNLVVAWESITAYIDLVRTFFEIMALWAFFEWYSKRREKWLYICAVSVGLGLATKLTAITSLVIFSSLIFYVGYLSKYSLKTSLIRVSRFAGFALIPVIPWLLFTYINTGNPVYPFFSPILNSYFSEHASVFLISPLNTFVDVISLFFSSADPISPIYIIAFPLLVFYFKKLRPEARILFVYVILSILLWYLTPRSGGARFMMPYLAGFSILTVELLLVNELKHIKTIFLFTIFIVGIITIFYRGAANIKYIPVILGYQTKSDFLMKNLDFNFADFYDRDGRIKTIIGKSGKALVIGGHNLYYIDFPFVHESMVQGATGNFTHILVINTELPDKYKGLREVYEDSITNVKLYEYDEPNN